VHRLFSGGPAEPAQDLQGGSAADGAIAPGRRFAYWLHHSPMPEHPMRRSADDPIIVDRAEFVDALCQLLRGHVLVRVGVAPTGCLLDGAPLRRSFGTLLQFGLIAPFDNPAGFPGVDYYRITDQGRWFARRALEFWRSLPLWRRTLVRLTG
jgi:hypothetical protein